ncbi:hypothetical protein DV711_04925 [Motiliproteus coralliicola]|uniref:Uncharacterized protein n=1 Tax=Motiliproteus coralliicola TaxID=2283196 RepID=A0A369WTC8_9GAMM|nr:hypothetical protein [Motiliproteus coralliicola]RDE24927.1 hypothetical protein DV711_04925 [Motiliproteus coralliicola]
MILRWSLFTNAKSEKNAQVLLNIVRRELSVEPKAVQYEGDRYSGHRIEFELHYPQAGRAEQCFQLLKDAEKLANSWTLTGVKVPMSGWSNRSRVGGITQMEWQELDPQGLHAKSWRER